jgi:hypothetical protein
MMERFTGTIENLGAVNVSEMIEWIGEIPLVDWPQQSATELRPSMVTDLQWRGFGNVAWPVVQHLHFDGSNTYQHMLSVVMPGHTIDPHRDSQADYWKFRVHVPLMGNSRSHTIMDDGKHNMRVGWAYKINVLGTHAVENGGATPRIHFMFDVRG